MLASALIPTVGVTRRALTPLVLTAVLVSVVQAAALAQNAQAPAATFKAGAEAVTLSVAVRDSRGHVIRDLTQSQFEVVDSGGPATIRDFYTGAAPISLAVLLDISGSMAVSGNIDRARHAVSVAMGMLNGGDDEASLFTFDSKLVEVVPFTKDLNRIKRVSLEGKPWGITSLYDAVAGAARSVAGRDSRHRALLVITDGVDTGSRLSAPEVSGIASSIDVPVYLLTVVNPIDHPGGEYGVLKVDDASASTTTLADLSRWTGGDMWVSSVPAHTVVALQDLFGELRHQYLISFDPGTRPGWHPLEVRVRNKNLIVHARSGYMAGPARLEDQ